MSHLNGFGWFVTLICALLLYGLGGWWWEADEGGRVVPALLIVLLLAVLASVLASLGQRPPTELADGALGHARMGTNLEPGCMPCHSATKRSKCA